MVSFHDDQGAHGALVINAFDDKNYLFTTSNPDLFTQGLTQDVQGGPQGVILPIKPYINGRAMFLNGSIP